MSKITDVAELAGVSRTLVSRYINGKIGVGAENKIKIEAAIKQLDYRRNDIARSLVQQKTGAIGIIVDSLCGDFIFEMIKGLEAGGSETGYKVIFCETLFDSDKKAEYVDYFSHSRVDGLVLYGSFCNDNATIAELSRSGFPFVLVENSIPDVSADKVLLDNRAAMRKAVQVLYDKNYRKISMMCWGLNTYAGQERMAGFIEGMKECGLPVTEETTFKIEKAHESLNEVRRITRSLIENRALPEAMVFAVDEYAYASMEVLYAAGLTVPTDIAVFSFDMAPYYGRQFMLPYLTTFRQPLYEMGQKAVFMLAERIEATRKSVDLPARTLVYEAEMIPGQTI